jgi:hypothetical protein
VSFIDDALNTVVKGLGISGPAPPALTPAQNSAFTALANSSAGQSEGTGVATAGLGPANALLGGPGGASGVSNAGTAATPVGAPFSGAGRWLVAFGLLAGIALLTSESSRYGSLGFAILAVIVASYFVVEYGRITSGLSNLWGGGPALNPGGA